MAQASSRILKWNPRVVLLFLLILNPKPPSLSFYFSFFFLPLLVLHGFPTLSSCRWLLVLAGVPRFSRSEWMTRRGKSQGVALWRSFRGRQRMGNEWKGLYERGARATALVFRFQRRGKFPHLLSRASYQRSFLITNTPDSWKLCIHDRFNSSRLLKILAEVHLPRVTWSQIHSLNVEFFFVNNNININNNIFDTKDNFVHECIIIYKVLSR